MSVDATDFYSSHAGSFELWFFSHQQKPHTNVIIPSRFFVELVCKSKIFCYCCRTSLIIVEKVPCYCVDICSPLRRFSFALLPTQENVFKARKNITKNTFFVCLPPKDITKRAEIFKFKWEKFESEWTNRWYSCLGKHERKSSRFSLRWWNFKSKKRVYVNHLKKSLGIEQARRRDSKTEKTRSDVWGLKLFCFKSHTIIFN